MSRSSFHLQYGLDYSNGRLFDFYEAGPTRGSAAALLWHGSGANERDVLGPMAEQLAIRKVSAIVPDWDTADRDGARDQLMASIAHARRTCGLLEIAQLALIGWSLGANAGLDFLMKTSAFASWLPSGFVGLAGSFNGSAFSADGPGHDLESTSTPILLIHGTADEVVPVESSRRVADELMSLGCSVELREIDTDHAGVIGMIFDQDRHRCVETSQPERLRTLATVSDWIADFVLSSQDET
jgi:dienelactone hydrolase